MVKLENKLGSVVITDEYLMSLAGYAATGCFGVVGMAARSTLDGIMSMLKTDNISRGVRVRALDNVLDIDIHIIVTYGCNITAVVKNIVHKVKYTLEDATGFKVRDVNIFVDGMKA